MPSSKPKIYAYLPENLYRQVIQFKQERQLSSDSQALIVILSEYFNYNEKLENQSTQDITERIVEVEAKLSELALLFNASNVTLRYSAPRSVPSTLPNEGISQRQLAKRLGCSMETLQKYRSDSSKLLEWTKNRDKDGLGWEFKAGKYYPI